MDQLHGLIRLIVEHSSLCDVELDALPLHELLEPLARVAGRNATVARDCRRLILKELASASHGGDEKSGFVAVADENDQVS